MRSHWQQQHLFCGMLHTSLIAAAACTCHLLTLHCF